MSVGRSKGRPKINLPVDVDLLLKRYETGEQLPAIAKSVGMSERTLYRRLLEHPEQWRAAQEGQALQRYEQTKTQYTQSLVELERLKKQLDDEGITDATDRNWRLAHVKAINQAYEKAVNRAEWELERLVSRLYGQKQEVTMTVNVGLADRLLRARERVIDGERLDAPQQSSGNRVLPTD